LTTSTNCSISDNIASSNLYGIYLYSYSNNNTLTNNTASSNTQNGILLNQYSSSNTLTNNTASSNNGDGIQLSNSDSNTLINNNALSNNDDGIYLHYSDSNTLTNNNASSNNGDGIHLYNSDGNMFTNNTVSGNTQNGIYLHSYSDSNTLTDNIVLNNTQSGIHLYDSSSNKVHGNNASDNTGYGLYLYSSKSNTIIKNNALNNGYGYYIGASSSFNILSVNNLIDNINYNAHDIVGSNSWYYNHYGDYTGSDPGNDGIGDTAYYITGDAGAKDILPTMQPWNMSENFGFGADLTLYSSNNITLYEGYSLTLQEIHPDGNMAWFTFEKDGNQVDSMIINTDEHFSYIRTIDGTDHLIFQGVLDTVFQGTSTQLIKITSFYQFSEIDGSVLIDNSNDLPKPAPSITLSSPSSSSISNTEGDSATFTATFDQVADVTWILDGNTIQTNTSVTTASYYNTSAKAGIHNLTVFAENTNGTDQKNWTWTVAAPPAPSITLSSPSSSSISNIEGDSTTFTATVDQISNVTWILDGNTIQTNTSIQTASYYNTSAKTGTHNLTVFAENANGTDQKNWTWTVSEITAPSITLLSPSAISILEIVGDSRTFTVNVDQVSNVTWVLNGNIIQTNTSVTTASYYNNSAQSGTHNLTVVAENANGTDQKKWTWYVGGASLTLKNGETKKLYEGYSFIVQQIDVDGEKIWFTIEKDGIELESRVISSDDTFSYSRTIDGSSHLILQGILKEVFQGMTTSIAIIDNLYQFSETDGSILIGGSDDLDNIYPTITLSSPSSSSFTENTGDSRTFIVNVSQVANVTWIIDGNIIQTNASVTTASYYNSSAQEGVHNVTVVAENTNGTDQKQWTWSVGVPMSSVYDGSITEGDGYQINNYVIDVTDVFISANTAVFKVYDKGILKSDTMLSINDSFSFDFEGSTVQLTLRSTISGVLSRASVLIETDYNISDLHTNGIVSGGHEYATYIDNTYTMQLQKGWNLVSTPLIPDTPDVNTLFDSNSDVILPVYSWNTANKQYYDVSTIEISKGYWILALNDTQITFAGTPYSG